MDVVAPRGQLVLSPLSTVTYLSDQAQAKKQVQSSIYGGLVHPKMGVALVHEGQNMLGTDMPVRLAEGASHGQALAGCRVASLPEGRYKGPALRQGMLSRDGRGGRGQRPLTHGFTSPDSTIGLQLSCRLVGLYTKAWPASTRTHEPRAEVERLRKRHQRSLGDEMRRLWVQKSPGSDSLGNPMMQ